jgi:nucleoside-diphosphate-sugar epimerase
MKVFVTGSSSHLAAALLPRLCAHPEIEQVSGVDIAPPRFQHARFSATTGDIRDPRLESLLAGHDALVHLAGVVPGGRLPEQEMFDINVNGSHKVFHAARRAGVRRLIHMSSAAVYGGGVHLSEAAPLKPLPQLAFARHQAHLEKLLEIDFPECVRFRPHFVLGPHARPTLRRLFNLPCYVSLREPHPLLQCVHEDDAARAVVLALGREVRGPFNLAIEDNFNLREIARRRHRLAVPVPLFAARGGLRLARSWFGWSGEPAWIDGLTRTLLVNCRRAAVELGWRSTHDAASVLAQT